MIETMEAHGFPDRRYHQLLVVFCLTFCCASGQSVKYSPPQRQRLDNGRWLEQCPLSCRCSQIRAGHELLRRWQEMKSAEDVNILENAIDQGHRFRRDFSSGATNGQPGRDMMCLGLRELPTSIPSDIVRMSVFGEEVKPPTANKVTYNASVRLGGITARDIIFQTSNQLTTISKRAFRGSLNLLELSIVGNDVRYITPNEFEYLPNLVSLNLKSNRLKSLQPRTFQGLEQLQELRLSKNELHGLPIDIFSDVHSLNKLYLDRNFLRSLHVDIFRGLHKLEVLDLSFNNITYLPRTIFAGNKNIKELNLDNNLLDRINQDWFPELMRLRKLSINGNRIIHLDPGSLTGVSMVKELFLSGNKISRVHAVAFKDFEHLRKLDLSDNSIISLPAGTFKNTRALHHLNLSKNRLSFIRKDMFGTTSSLMTLDLSENAIDKVSRETFNHLTSLQKLDLSRNKITELKNGTFLGLRKLRELNLAHNKIREINDRSFSVSLSRFVSQLTWLNLQHNLLNVISAENFRTVPHLKFLNLANNQIQSLDGRSFRSQKQLNSLILSNNQITSLPIGMFETLKNVRHLNIGHNKLKSLPRSVFNGLSSLEELKVQGNRLSFLSPHALSDAPLLARANFSVNSLSHVNMDSFSNNKRLSRLDLSRNDIKEVTLGVNRGLQLKLLSLMGNKLRSLHSDVSGVMATGGTLALGDNPWTCDCHLSWLRYLVPIWQLELQNQDQLVCYQPAKLRGKRVLSVRQSDFVCRGKGLMGNGDRRETGSAVRRPPVRERQGSQKPRNPHEKSVSSRSSNRRIYPFDDENFRQGFNPYKGGSAFPFTTASPLTTRRAPITDFNKGLKRLGGYDRIRSIKPKQNLAVGSLNNIQRKNKSNITDTRKTSPTTTTWRTPFPDLRSRWWRNLPHTSRRPDITTTSTFTLPPKTVKPLWNHIGYGRHDQGYFQTKSTAAPTFKPLTTTKASYRIPFHVQNNPTPKYSLSKWWKPRPIYGARTTKQTPTTTLEEAPADPFYGRRARGRVFKGTSPKRYSKKANVTPATALPKRLNTIGSVKKEPSVINSWTTKPQHFTTTTHPPRVTPTPKFMDRSGSSDYKGSDTKLARAPSTNKQSVASRKSRHCETNDPVELDCPTGSEWRLHFDKALIRRHKAEVKDFHVTIMNSKRKPGCNGVLISDWWALTSASCVEKNLANPRKIRDPKWKPNLQVKIGLREMNKAVELLVNPVYLLRRLPQHDFALMKLKYESLMTKVVAPPCVLPPEWFQSRPAWVVPGVASARFDGKNPKSSLQTLTVKVWETDCANNPASCLRIEDPTITAPSAFTEGAPIYLGYSETRWTLIGLGSSGGRKAAVGKYLPVWTVLKWLKSVTRP